MTPEEFEYFFEPEELGLLPDLPRRPRRGRRARREGGAPRLESGSDVAHKDGDGQTKQTSEVPPAPLRPNEEQAAELPSEKDNRRPAEVEGSRSTEAAKPARPLVRNIISVHALGQFVYCPRSAILAFEQGDDRDVDEPPPQLDYLPNYDLELIEEELKGSLRTFWVAIPAMIVLAVLTLMGLRSGSRLWFFGGLFVSTCCLARILNAADKTVRLAVRRRKALRAEAGEPDANIEGPTAVNWWSMLKAGFESVNYHRPFRHPELPLEGNTWRVLERGSLRIPVVRSGADKLGARKDEVYLKHRLRLAAHAILLEAMGQVESPYGIVFPARSTNGLAIPITAAMRAEVSRLLEEFSAQLQRSQSGESEPNAPRQSSRCTKCHYGAPVAITARAIKKARKSGEKLLVLQQPSGRRFHCDCGDRFGSAPPHQRSIQLRLTTALE